MDSKPAPDGWIDDGRWSSRVSKSAAMRGGGAVVGDDAWGDAGLRAASPARGAGGRLPPGGWSPGVGAAVRVRLAAGGDAWCRGTGASEKEQ
jgi:hypothetical protein